MEKNGMTSKEKRVASKKLFCIKINPEKSPLKILSNNAKSKVSPKPVEKKSNGFKIEKMTNKEIENYVKSL